MPENIYDRVFTTTQAPKDKAGLGNVWDARRSEYPHLNHVPTPIFKAYCNFQDAYNRLKEQA